MKIIFTVQNGGQITNFQFASFRFQRIKKKNWPFIFVWIFAYFLQIDLYPNKMLESIRKPQT